MPSPSSTQKEATQKDDESKTKVGSLVQVRFFHLQRTGLDIALGRMLLKVLQRKQKAFVFGNDAERLSALSHYLWTFSDSSFMPHGLLDDSYPEQQPILLGTDITMVNEPNVLFLLDQEVQGEKFSAFEQVVLLFGMDESSVQKARVLWKNLKDKGTYDLSYWQESLAGKWEKKA